MRAPLATLVLTSAFITCYASPVSLTGYFCATCPSTPNPAALLASLHPAYDSIIFAFAGWDTSGALQNQYDAPDKGFFLNASVVRALRARGVRRVALSLGGGAGNVLPAPLPPAFAVTMLAGLTALVTELSLDGVDFDLENFPGSVADILQATTAVRAVAEGLRAAQPAIVLSAAPQMTDAYCDYASLTSGFNRYAPLLSPPQIFDLVTPQMYNSWSSVETIAYAKTYAAELEAGCAVGAYNVSVDRARLQLGYPASRSAAGSGFLPPSDVAAMARALGVGVMTWDVGWDAQAGWEMASAVAAA
jgi:chitinase